MHSHADWTPSTAREDGLLLRRGKAEGTTPTTLAVWITAEKGRKSCGDDKRSACGKTIQSDSSKDALKYFSLTQVGVQEETVKAEGGVCHQIGFYHACSLLI